MAEQSNIKKKWKDMVEHVTKPRKELNGMAVCPFLKKERVTEGLMLRVWRPNEESFFHVLDEFVESNKSSALLVCMDSGGIIWEEISRKKYQKAIQLAMENKGYKKHKALCFSPFEDWTAAGEETRKKSPYFLINLAETDA